MAIEIARRKLAALLPPDTNIHYIAMPVQPTWRYTVEEIDVINVTAVARQVRLYHCVSGGGVLYNSLLYDATLAANSSLRREGKWYLNPGEAIGVRSSFASGLAFTISGIIEALTAGEIEALVL